ncbi:hypothetical protein [Flavobacterium sp. 7A]|nr:hypothetical protein [Flavobacterium sp. 7A]MCW2121078.1 hypothetical protein [Flavobacterium sp. 7A]
MKIYSLNEVVDKFIDKKGIANRANYENELKINLSGQTIEKSQKKQDKR